MSATQTSAPPVSETAATAAASHGGLLRAVQDGLVVTRRNLIKIKRIPDMLIFTLIQPIMFVALFAFVFGGAIPVEGGNYREFLMGGIFAQTLVFGAGITAIGLADDIQKGLIDRFRSLPMARSAVLVGRTTSDLVNNVLVLVIMSLTGLAVGWRIHNGFWSALGAYGVLLFFAYAMSWVLALIGLSVRSVEVAQSAGFIWLFPATFLSTAFVPLEKFEYGWLQAIATWNPVSAVAQTAREGFGNTIGNPPQGAFPVERPVLYSILWCVGLIVVFLPLCVRKYRSAASR